MEGADLSLLHKKPLLSQTLAEATQGGWPQKAVAKDELTFHADDSIVAAIMGLGEVTGSADEDPDATATEDLQAVLHEASSAFDDQADEEGEIGSNELKQLCFYLYVKGESAPDELAVRLKEEVEATMERFEKGKNDKINKTEFKRMLCSNPWKVLLPETARTNTTLMRHYFGL